MVSPASMSLLKHATQQHQSPGLHAALAPVRGTTQNDNRCPLLDDDMLAAIFEELDGHSEINESTTATDFCLRLTRTRGYQTLHRTIPLVSQQFNLVSRFIRYRHVNVMTSSQLLRFSNEHLGKDRMASVTRLDVGVDSRHGLISMAEMLPELPKLEELSVRHWERAGCWTQYASPSSTNGMPASVVEAISRVVTLRTLVIHSGATKLSRENLDVFGQRLSALSYLHIPALVVRQHPEDGSTVDKVLDFPLIRTLSAGFPGRRQGTNLFGEVLRNASVPNLQRINLGGMSWEDLTGYGATLGRVRVLECVCSNWRVWEALESFHERDPNQPLLEEIVLHIDGRGASFGEGLPHLQTVTLLDDEFDGREGDARKKRIEEALEGVWQWKSGCARLHTVLLRTGGGKKGIEDILTLFADRLSEKQVRLDIEDLVMTATGLRWGG